ncbi:hypothetical protein [Methylobacterium sp. Leaf108]|uniref:hypothetical protein n=1 Tax=Methylobacterium sp. Leaf108 TaxID=1736256 RepID=UPI000B1EACE9|nr:hypothetical protein [Methylobacterium sp. Leaf108]
MGLSSRRRVIGWIGAAGVLVSTGAAVAGTGHSHAAPNGGQIRDIGAYEVELVAKGADLVLYLVDAQEKKVDAAGFSAKAVVLAKGNEQKTVALAPAGDNRLSGRMNFTVEGKLRATVTLTAPSGEAGKGRFSLDAAR